MQFETGHKGSCREKIIAHAINIQGQYITIVLVTAGHLTTLKITILSNTSWLSYNFQIHFKHYSKIRNVMRVFE